MSCCSSSPFDRLPAELIYHLLEYLDISTIFISFRHVCKRFYTIVNSHDRYHVDMRLISKSDFDHLCRLISPANVLSLILSDDFNTPYQIQTFLSRFALQQCCQLHSLTLIKINESNLFTLLVHLSKCTLKSLTIECFAWDTFTHTVRLLLSSIIVKSKLEYLHLNISYRDLDAFACSPLPTTLKCLHLEHCTFQEYCMILRHSINLQKLSLTKCLMSNLDGSMYQPPDDICPVHFRTLSFGACFIRMKELCILLSCTPSVEYLKVIIWTDSCDSVINGNEWEKFIKNKLINLQRFEFFFDDLTQVTTDSLDLQTYVKPFETPFWLKNHRWYVTCDYIKSLAGIRLYSLPICNPMFMYYTNSSKISLSTLPTSEKDHVEITQYVNNISLNLNETLERGGDKASKKSSESALFRRLECLSVNFDGRHPYTSLSSLRTLIDLSSVVRLTIQLLVHNFAQKTSLSDYLSAILREASNIHTLKLTYIHSEESLHSTQSLCTLIPHTVQHLQISISNFKEMKMILEQVPQLFSVTFYSSDISNYCEDIEQWLKMKRSRSLCRHGLRCIQIWLGNCHDHDQSRPRTRRLFGRFHRRSPPS
ncbi:unnamed protein product [Adineta ricciae]|uniref:F-box domain-containing protein n=1 Tax=Adineta ricciae TaxID=249248 RepID=A0A815IUZ8_ADIRI|nr:unnamed protein product [Adineta ricciae]